MSLNYICIIVFKRKHSHTQEIIYKHTYTPNGSQNSYSIKKCNIKMYSDFITTHGKRFNKLHLTINTNFRVFIYFN